MEFTDFSIDKIEHTQKFGGNVYESLTPSKVLDFSGNCNILKTPREIVRGLKKVPLSMRPDPEYKKAVCNLSQKHGVNAENLALDSNVYSLIDVVIKSLKSRGASVVMPCETAYKDIFRMNYCDVLPYVLQERRNFKLDCDDVIETITVKTDTFFISNPNNVTGRVVSRSDMRTILDFCLTKGIYVVVDETYMDFVLENHSVANMIKDYYNLVVIRSLPEYYNVAGIGASYVISSPEIIENIKINQLPWQLDGYSAALCENAYKSEKFDLKTKKWIFENKKKFIKKINALGTIKIIHSDCHFLLLKLEDISATTVYNRLLRSNILIRDASSFTGLDGSYIRVAVKDEKSNDLFLESLLRCLI